VLGKTAAEAANAIAEGTDAAGLPGVGKFSGGAKGVEVNAILIEPNPITRENLSDVIDAGWVTKEKVCAGVPAGAVPACG
jgi:D-xylose transport system substrate-binding protein